MTEVFEKDASVLVVDQLYSESRIQEKESLVVTFVTWMGGYPEGDWHQELSTQLLC